MSACGTFTEHVWKPGECKNCFKPKSLHRLGQQAAGCKASSELRPPSAAQTQSTHLQLHQNQNHHPPGSKPNNNNNPSLTNTGSSQRAGTIGPPTSSSAARSAHFRPPVAKKPTIAVKPTMMLLPCSPTTAAGLDSEGNLPQQQQRSPPPQEETPGGEAGKNTLSSPFADVWKLNGLNQKRPSNGPNNNNEGEVGLGGGGRGGGEEMDGYGPLSPIRAPSRNNNNNGLSDVLKEIAGLVPGPLSSGSRDLFFGRINTSYRRSLERGLPASSCLAMGSGGGGGGEVGGAHKRVSLSDGAKVISTEGGRFCYPEFSSEDEEDDEDEEEEEDDEEESDDDDDDEEHESWDESDEELLAMEIRMRGQPRFSNFRAATLSPVPFMVGKDKWNTVPLRNRSLQRICAVDYDDSYDEILNGYPSPCMDSNGVLLPHLPYGPAMGFLSHSESVASPESSSTLPEESCTTSSSGSSAPCGLRNGLHSPSSPPSSSSASKALPLPSATAATTKKEPDPRMPQSCASPTRVLETHKAVLAIRLEEQDGRDGAPMPQALPGQPVTISFSPTEEQAKPYRVVNLEKPLICKPYTVVDVSASMANKEDTTTPELFSPKHKTPCSNPCSPVSFATSSPSAHPLSPVSPAGPLSSPISPTSPTTTTSGAGLPGNTRRKPGNIRYQEVWTSSTSPRQKIPKVELGVQFSSHPGPAIPPRHCSHKSAPTSPIAGLSSAASSCSRTVPVKSSNLSEIKFNSYNNAGMPPFPIIIRDEPAYARSHKNAVKVPIVINPSAYDNLAVYKSFLGLSGELPQPKGASGSGSGSAAGGGGSSSRVVSHTYEEIGSSESIQSSSTEKTLSGKGTSERASFDDARATPDMASRNQNLHSLHSKTTTDSGTVSSTVLSSAVGPVSPSTPSSTVTPVAALLPFTASLPKSSPTAPAAVVSPCSHKLVSGGDTLSSKGSSTGTDYSFSFGTGLSHREEASAVLSQIVASIQPPQSPPSSEEPPPPSSPAQSKTFGSEELYSLPPNDSSNKESLFRPKSLFTSSASTDGCLSKPGRKEASSKLFPKSQSASSSSAVASPPSSPKSAEPGAPFPPPRSTSSPYHASNILQRHFSNWTSKTSSPSSSSPSRPGEGGETGLAAAGGGGGLGGGAEGRRSAGGAASEATKPKRWISFKSFFRRRKDEDEQREKTEKEKGKLVGLDGTVIHMLPPPPIQRQHWFTEAKPEDPTQKPTLIFSYRPDGGAGAPSDGEGELECKETALLSEGGATISPARTPSPLSTGPDLLSQVMREVLLAKRWACCYVGLRQTHITFRQVRKLLERKEERRGGKARRKITVLREGRTNNGRALSKNVSRSAVFNVRSLGQQTDMGSCVSQYSGHVPIITSDARGGGASLPAKLELSSSQEAGLCLGEGLGVDVGAASEGSTSLGEEPEEDGSHSHHSNSPASSSCSATYSNLGQSRANMIPLKQPRNIKASDDTLASNDHDYDNNTPPPPLLPKATPPPPLPKKSSAAPLPGRSNTEPNLLGLGLGAGGNNNKDNTCLRAPRGAEAKPTGTNLSVANPLYDLDSTWETASQSSSLSSEPPHHLHHHHQPHHPNPTRGPPHGEQENGGDSLERPGVAAVAPIGTSMSNNNKSRPANSLSSLVSPPPSSGGAPPPPGGAGNTGSRERRGYRSTECLTSRVRTTGRGAAAAAGGGGGGSKPHRPVLYRGMDSWEEVVGRIRGLHTDTLRKLAAKCEDRFMAGQKDHLRFGTDSWSHFRLTTGKPCCEAGDAVYYTASYAKDPLVNYAIKICRSKVKATQQQFFHSLAVRQSLSVHFNIQQDCGHFLADVPARLLPWEEEEGEEDAGEEEEEEEEEEVDEGNTEKLESTEENATSDSVNSNGKPDDSRVGAGSHAGTPGGRLSSRVVVITREVPFQTVADFVREGVARHTRNPELYERQVCLLLLQLCSGLEHMKPYHVTHCDLRLENLLLVHCHLGQLCNNDLSEPNNNGNGGAGASSTAGASANAAANSTCPARLIISNFSQAKQKSPVSSSSSTATSDRETMRDQSRLAPELVTATQYRKCDEFQTGILIYEMLHRPNPFEETPELKEREYTWADLPPLPVRSLYSQGLQQLASLLLTVNPSERIRMAEARACLQCLLWGPREDLFQALGGGGVGGSGSGGGGAGGAPVSESQRETTLQNWLDLKRTLMMIKFAERSLDAGGGVSLEDWLCCQYLAFTTTDSLSRVVHILQQTQSAGTTQVAAQSPPNANPSAVHLAQPQTQTHLTHHTFHMKQTQPL